MDHLVLEHVIMLYVNDTIICMYYNVGKVVSVSGMIIDLEQSRCVQSS